jgi:hypothetical protein
VKKRNHVRRAYRRPSLLCCRVPSLRRSALSYPHTELTSRHCSDAEVSFFMNIIHDFHDNNSLDCLMTPAYIVG